MGEYEQAETIPATGLMPGETQEITLNNPPLRDANGDGEITGDDNHSESDGNRGSRSLRGFSYWGQWRSDNPELFGDH